MNIILWIGLMLYITTSVVFNILLLSFYEKEDRKDWSGNEFCDKFGMFLASSVWPILVIYGIFKMEKESKE